MNQEKLRLECLKLAINQQNLGNPIEIANLFYNFVKETKINLKNPVEFINQYFKLRPYQENAINLIHNNDRIIFNWARQIGATSTILNYIYYYAMNNSNKTIMLCSPKYSHAISLIDNFKDILENNKELSRNVLEYNKQTIKFDNGTKLITSAVTPEMGKGRTLNLLYIDNAAFISHKFGNEFWKNIYSSLYSCKTKIIVSSVPNEKQGLFYNLMNDDSFIKNTITAKQSNIYNDEKLNYLRYNLGEKTKQELDCEFKD